MLLKGLSILLFRFIKVFYFVIYEFVFDLQCFHQGHDILMATMLNGAAIMDGALLLIAANESCPQPQTSEHLAAVEIMRLQHIIILQNKVDLIQENVAINQHEAIQKFIQVTFFVLQKNRWIFHSCFSSESFAQIIHCRVLLLMVHQWYQFLHS